VPIPAGAIKRDAAARVSRGGWGYGVVVAPGVVGAAFLIQASLADRRIAERQQTTWGTIDSHEPGNHNRYGYSFEVNERRLTGWAIPKGNDHFAIGQRVTVFYDPSNPSRSQLEDFSRSGEDALAPVPLLLVGTAAALVLVHRFKIRRNRIL
jgi:hypothetical protein